MIRMIEEDDIGSTRNGGAQNQKVSRQDTFLRSSLSGTS
jgi:hypothetical protein